MFDWISSHDDFLGVVVKASLFVFVATLIFVAWYLVRIPPDYFVQKKGKQDKSADATPVAVIIRIGKNMLGYLLIVAGIAMLVLPGQGLLAILAGLMLVDFPGKENLQRRIVMRPAVLNSINWIRRRAGCKPLAMDA